MWSCGCFALCFVVFVWTSGLRRGFVGWLSLCRRCAFAILSCESFGCCLLPFEVCLWLAICGLLFLLFDVRVFDVDVFNVVTLLFVLRCAHVGVMCFSFNRLIDAELR